MKRFSITLAALAMAALTMAGVLSCQKEKTSIKEESQTDDTQSIAILNRIQEFKYQVEYYSKHPEEKSSQYLCVEDAVWNLEALFNYTYAYPELCYGQTVSIDTIMHLPLSANDSIKMYDLVTFYGCMFEAVRDIYRSVTLPDKQFIILDVEEGHPQSGYVEIVLNTMQGSVVPSTNEPDPSNALTFPSGVSWWYGENLGNSNGQHIGVMDAADTLSMVLNAELVPVAPQGVTYVYTYVTTLDTQEDSYPFSHPAFPDLGPYCEFYKENPSYPVDYWLTADQMNFHYLGEKHLLTNILPYENPSIPSIKTLFFISIEDYELEQPHRIGHNTTAKYGLQTGMSDHEKDKENLE